MCPGTLPVTVRRQPAPATTSDRTYLRSPVLADRERRARGDRAARLGDAGGHGVTALLQAARGAEVEADELARESGDRAGVAVAAGRTGDRVGGGNRVDRVAEVAHRKDHGAAADLGAARLQAVLLLGLGRVEADLRDQ